MAPKTDVNGNKIANDSQPPGAPNDSTNTPSVDTTTGTEGSKSKSKSYSLTPKETAYSEINQVVYDMFGFYPSAAVAEKYYKQLHAREKQYATKSSSKGGGTYSSTRNSDASGNSATSYTSGNASSSVSRDFGFNKTLFLNDYATSLAKTYLAKGKTFGGTARENYNTIANYANDMGVALSETTLINNTINTIVGKADVNKTKADILTTASRFYPAIADLLKSDPTKTVRQHIGGYIETAASMLDVEPTDISINDKSIQSLLTYVDDKGNHLLKSKAGFMADLRDDSRFKFGTYAKNEAVDLGKSLASAMGFGAA